MDNKNDTMEFELEDILSEFHAQEDAALSDTGTLPELSLSDLMSELSLSDEPVSAPSEEPVSQEETIRFELTSTAKEDSGTEEEPAAEEFQTQVEAQEQPASEEHPEEEPTTVIREIPEEEFTAPAPIVFTPKSRLRELKKKLVAGPERRYYELEGQGLGKIQVAMLICLALVAVCAAVATLFNMDLMPENRLRLVIFTQVLSMMVAGLMCSSLMLDSLGELFRGRFTVNTMLTLTFAACFADGIFCLKELRIPCCAAFCLEATMALWARYHRHTTEMAQMDTMRKAVRLHGLVKVADFYNGKPGLLRKDADVEDFMDNYNKMSGPELAQSLCAGISLIACMGIAVLAALRHGVSMGVQILATSLLVAVPATAFVSVTRPMALLENRLHMVGSVFCGWKGVKGLCGKAAFPLTDTDLFPQGATKLNGVKFYADRDPDEVVSYTASLITKAGGGLVPVFRQLLTSRNGELLEVENFQNYVGGGIGGEVRGEPVLLGSMNFLQDMGVEIPEGTMVSQAVYAAIDGQLCAVYAMSYAKMRSAAAGLVTLCGYRKLTPILLCGDFTLSESFLRAKFNVKTRRMVFPTRDERAALSSIQPDPECPVYAISTREELVSTAYLVTGARSVRGSTTLAVAIHMVGGIVGLLIMLALAILGNTELLTPINILLYQLIWAVPGLLVTEWTRIV